jgi:hypothetical protein
VAAGPVFRPITRHGRMAGEALSAPAVAVVKASLSEGMTTADAQAMADYSGHSLRAGHATSAAQNSERRTGACHPAATAAQELQHDGWLHPRRAAVQGELGELCAEMQCVDTRF